MCARAIATIGSGPIAKLLDLSLPALNHYGDVHGYEVVVGDGESYGRPPAWAKVPLLQRLLATYDTVLWIDADAIIMDSTVDVASAVPGAAFQALAGPCAGNPPYINTGVWLLRAGDRASQFLDAVWAATEFIDHAWWENAAVIDLLGFELQSVHGPVRESQWMSDTQFLPEEWNMLVYAYGLRRCRIRHYASTPLPKRERWLRADAARIAAARANWAPFPAARYAGLATSRWCDRHVPRSPHELREKLVRRFRRTS